MRDSIKHVLQTLKSHFGSSIFTNPRQFKAALADIPITTDGKLIRNLLNIAVCDMQAYSRLETSIPDKNLFIVDNLVAEMSSDYMINKDTAKMIITCIAELLGYISKSENVQSAYDLSGGLAKVPEGFRKNSHVENRALIALNNELSKIEALVRECEKEIKDRKISASIIVSQIQNITNPAAQIDKGKEWIGALLGKADKLNLLRLKELKNTHPDNSRVNELGRRAVNCYMALSEISFSVSETLVSSDMKPAVRAGNQKMREGFESVFRSIFQ